MPRPTSRTTNDPWAGLTANLATIGEKRPVGPHWLSSIEIARKLSKGLGATKMLIKRNRGQFEMFRGCVAKNGKLVNSVWWRPIPLAKQSKRLKTQGNNP